MQRSLPKHRSAENPSRSDFGPLELTDRTFSRPELSYVTAPGSWDSGSDQQLGIGSIEPILPLPPNLDGYKFLWAPPPAASSNGTLSDLVDGLVDRVFQGVGGNIIKVDDEDDIERACPTNFNLRSECFAALVFNEVDDGRQVLVSTI